MTGQRPQHTVIVGGGLSGLAAARDLALAGQRVTLLESSPVVGGLASSRLLKGEMVEHFYHFICRDDDSLLNLVHELGLGLHLRWGHAPTAFFHAGRHYQFSSPFDLLRFTAVPFGQRVRLGWHVARSVLQSDWRDLDGLSARAWLIDNIGEEAYNVIWHPLLRVKFGDYYDKISAAWLWHRIVRVARSRRPRWGRSVFGYLTHGSETIVRALRGFLAAQPNVSLQPGSRVVSVDLQDNAVRGVRLEQGAIDCSAVISTVALPVLDRLVPAQTSQYFDRIRRVQYIGVVCALFSLKRPFTRNFWLNINDPGISFNGIIEQTNLNKNLREAGLNVLYVPHYLATSEPRYGYTERELLDEYVPMLKLINPKFDESWIEEYSVARTAYAQAVCETHFADLRPNHRTPIRGLYVTDSTQFYPEDRTLSAAVEQGRKAAAFCLEDSRVV